MGSNYHKYLQTEEWEQRRNLVMKRADDKCELCGKKADHAHHIKYPKNLEQDSLKNLIAVCKTCHDKLHGLHEFNNSVLIEDVFNSMSYAIYDYMVECRDAEGDKDWYAVIKNIYNDNMEKVRGIR